MATQFFAHSHPSHGWEPLATHLSTVAEKAEKLAAHMLPPTGTLPAEQAQLRELLRRFAQPAGLLHDLGKYQPDWQQYLRDSAAGRPAKSVPHAIHGAAYAGYTFEQEVGPALALAIAGHHAGLSDWYHLCNGLESEHPRLRPVLDGILCSARSPSEGLDIPASLPVFPLDLHSQPSCRCYEFFVRVLFSLLVDADRLETERFVTGRERVSVQLDPTALLAHLDAERLRRAAGRDDLLTTLRNRVFEACVTAGEQAQGFFDLTVPTGGGKTLSSMAFALAHARKHQLRRIIVVIPYLSIIEQNAKDYKQVLGTHTVVEHHSAVAPESGGRESAVRTPAELATENWDAPVIVTTSVQFLETLLAASPRRCRKLHNISRSVVLFDEAQALPPHILNPLLNVFRELVTNYGTSIVFSTATQPAFRHSVGLSEGLLRGELRPILGDPLRDELYRNLRRVRYHIQLDRPWSWDELADRLAKEPQVVCVLNTRAHARAVWELLRIRVRDADGDEKGVVHLSSAMCAQHRLDVFGDKDNPRPGTVRYRLLHGQPCRLVSTQVIEAGVDVDFPQAFRAIGPLSSVVQVAGRCNREGRLKDPTTGQPCLGDVFVFQPAEGGMPPGFYQAATGEARTLLGEITEEQLATDPEVFARYFDTLFNVTSTDSAAKGEKSVQQLRAEFMFEEVARRARVIEDGGTAVLVPYGRAVKKIAAIRHRGFYDRRTLRLLQRFTVNLRPRDLAKLKQVGQITPLVDTDGEEGPLVLDLGSYSLDLGVVIDGRPVEDYIG